MSLTEIIKDEYGAKAVANNKDAESFLSAWDDAISKFTEDEKEAHMGALSDITYGYFTQGFLRGVAAAKSGAV